MNVLNVYFIQTISMVHEIQKTEIFTNVQMHEMNRLRRLSANPWTLKEDRYIVLREKKYPHSAS